VELILSSSEEFDTIFNKEFHVFNTGKFADINRNKCENIFYFIFKDSKYRLGLIAGLSNDILLSPFSSPFGGFVCQSDDIQISKIELAVDLLYKFCLEKKIKTLQINMPPLFYSETFISKYLNVFYRNGFNISKFELDFYFCLDDVDLENKIWYNAKKNLKIAIKNELIFEKVDNDKLDLVYEIIKQNRNFKNKPLNMTIKDLQDTIKVISTDLFICRKDNHILASSIVFRVNKKIAYIPFWGDNPSTFYMRPMNFLSDNIVKFYKSLEFKYVHIGISTENSVPNYGLCEFKESLGCNITPKLTLTRFIK
jgi:hypothetical protein